ncbi:MAG: Calx-beta domain-containing protein, partial [Bacteroidota bacterium]
MKTNTSKSAVVQSSILFLLLFLFIGSQLYSQANSIRTGATFNWADTQPTINDPATIESIEINGSLYNTFVVPSSYALTRLGPGGHNGNDIMLNGSEVLGTSSAPTWNARAIEAYQSLNLNHYFESNSNGDNFCENYSAVSTTDTQIQTITYAPGIPSNPNGILAVTERGGNNCFYIEVWGTPVGGGPEQQLGQTFVRNEFNLTGVGPQQPPTANSDYWSSGRNNDSGQIIGIALYQLSELAPIGSTITQIRYYAATTDNGDGKFFLMQTYAQDDSFNPDFEEVFSGDAGANDNVPSGTSYTYFSSSPPFNGTVVVNSDGTFTYTPDPGFTGTDTFEIQVCLPAPNAGVCDISTVTLNVKSGVSINNASADEGDNLTFTISINDPINQDVDFNLTYTNNSTIDSDYSGPTSITLPANDSSVSFDVLAVDDLLIEPTETFTVTVVNPSDIVTILDGDGNGTINDDDAAGSGVQFNATNISVTEGTDPFARFTVSFNGTIAPGEDVTVDYLTNDGTANDGSDFTAQSGTITFNSTNTSFDI